MNKKKLAIVGFGGVGKAFFKLIKKYDAYEVVTILNSTGGIHNPEGIDNINENWIDSMSYQNMIENHMVDVVIELTPSNHESGQPGFSHIKTALEHKKHVVTGNKGPFIHGYYELFDLAKIHNVQLKIGCTVGGALPSLIVGEIGLKGGEIKEIQGVLNGTSNMILDLMDDEVMSYEDALEKAIVLKIAEKDCSLDVGGFDTAAKLMILSQSLLGPLDFKEISVEGLETYNKTEKHINQKIRLVGQARRTSHGIKASVGLKILGAEDPLFHVSGKNKGVTYKSDLFGEVTVTGGASGVVPAAGALLRDLLSMK
jgi:homoserine dehydrogenase